MIRDHLGGFFVALVKRGLKISLAGVTKFAATFEATTFVIKARFRYIVLKGNNLGVTNVTKRSEVSLPLSGVIVADITKFALVCNRICVSFVKMEGKSVGHALAKFAKSVSECEIWLKEPLVWLEEFMYDNSQI